MVPVYEIPEGSTDCKNCRGISLIVVGKICAGVVGDRVHNVSEKNEKKLSKYRG